MPWPIYAGEGLRIRSLYLSIKVRVARNVSEPRHQIGYACRVKVITTCTARSDEVLYEYWTCRISDESVTIWFSDNRCSCSNFSVLMSASSRQNDPYFLHREIGHRLTCLVYLLMWCCAHLQSFHTGVWSWQQWQHGDKSRVSPVRWSLACDIPRWWISNTLSQLPFAPTGAKDPVWRENPMIYQAKNRRRTWSQRSQILKV